jgi:hypothetical protein
MFVLKIILNTQRHRVDKMLSRNVKSYLVYSKRYVLQRLITNIILSAGYDCNKMPHKGCFGHKEDKKHDMSMWLP